MPTTHVIYESDAVGGLPAALTVFAMLALGILAVGRFAVWWWRARASARSAERVERAAGTGALTPGSATILGRVEVDGDRPAVELSVTENGKEWNDEGWQHEWREVERSIHARRFVVRTRNGEAVLVEPGSAPQMIDDLELAARPSADKRVRRARVTHGETVRASGVLRREQGAGATAPTEGAYREPAQGGWVLRPPSSSPMLISTKPLAHAHRHHEKHHRGWTVAVFLLALLHQAVIGHAYYPLVLDGRPGTAEVVGRDTRVTHDDDGDPITHYELELVSAAHGTRFRAEVRYGDWRRVRVGESIAVVELPDGSLTQLGRSASVEPHVLWFALLTGLFVLVGFRGMSARRRLWWEQAPIVTQGSGRLAD